MSREVRSVRMADRLDAAARVLWEQDCGIVPVVDSANVLVGVLTDRDLCMAAYTQGRVLGEIPVTAVMARAVKTCRSDEPLAQAMATLHQAQVHRLPVVDGRGLLVGMLSTNDLVRTCQARPAALEAAALVKLLAAIGAPRAAATPLAVAAPAGASAAPAAAAVAAVPPAAVAVATAMPSVAVKAAVGKPVVVPPAAAPATVATPPVASGKGKPAAKGKSKKG